MCAYSHDGIHGTLDDLVLEGDAAQPGASLYNALAALDLVDAPEDQVRLLEQSHGETVYSELIYLLSHLRLDPADARRCWDEILAHRNSMARRLGSQVDLRVAMVSHFLDVDRLEQPKVIELELFERTRASVFHDELTGLFNYRFLSGYLVHEILRSRRSNDPLSLIMIDVDDFKPYNDRVGHEGGNDALREVSRILVDSLREVDIAVRYGGEEFVVLLPGTPKIGAVDVAERVRRNVESSSLGLTVSLGIATFPADSESEKELIRRADRAMYVAKAAGKNRVQLYGSSCRSYRRVEANIAGTLRPLSDEIHSLTALSIGDGGALLLTDRYLARGELVGIELNLPGASRQVAATGRVVGVEKNDEAGFNTYIRFTEVSPEDRRLLAGFLQSVATDAPHDNPDIVDC